MGSKAKKIFRYLRGELNGVYLNHLAYFVNNWIEKTLMPSLYYMRKVQFDYNSMTPQDIVNIAKTAGVVQAITLGRMTMNTLRMTTSELKDGNCYSVYANNLVISNPLEISERGLFDKNTEEFNFSYWDTTKPDIVENATPELQSALVPSDRTKFPVLGYIKEGSILYDREGKLLPREQWLLDTPPKDSAYSEFYGEQFLHFEEDFVVNTAIPPEVVYQMFVAIQEIRYNGSSVRSLAKLTDVIVGDIVKIGRPEYIVIEETSTIYSTWFYKVDKGNIEKPHADIRLNAWLNLIENFFPQIRMEEL